MGVNKHCVEGFSDELFESFHLKVCLIIVLTFVRHKSKPLYIPRYSPYMEVKRMSALTPSERMNRWTRALEKTMACADQVQTIDDPIARMQAYWDCRAGTSVRRRK
jgi:hypothetical protein